MIISFVFDLVIWFCLWRLMMAADNDTPAYISASKCSLDPVLNNQVDEMNTYQNNLAVMNIVTVVFMVILLVIDLFFGLWRACHRLCKKGHKKKQIIVVNNSAANQPLIDRPAPGGWH